MAAPGNSTDLINLALLKLYNGTITSPNDNSAAAAAASQIYDLARQGLLRNYLWNFARKRAKALLITSSVPAFDWQCFYQLPNDWLRLHTVGYSDDRFNCPVPYDIEQGKLCLFPINPTEVILASPPPSFNIMYTYDCVDVPSFDRLFINLLVAELACQLCMPVTGDLQLRTLLEGEKRDIIKEAQAINHQERPVLVTDVSRIARARSTDGESHFQIPVDPSFWGS